MEVGSVGVRGLEGLGVCACQRGPPPTSLATSVTSEILVAYIILDIDGEVDRQGVLTPAQGGTLLRQFAFKFLWGDQRLRRSSRQAVPEGSAG
jgi:hypothetical protein